MSCVWATLPSRDGTDSNLVFIYQSTRLQLVSPASWLVAYGAYIAKKDTFHLSSTILITCNYGINVVEQIILGPDILLMRKNRAVDTGFDRLNVGSC
jgi:hypothetical protein